MVFRTFHTFRHARALALTAILAAAVGCSSTPAEETTGSDDAALLDVECRPLPTSWMHTWRAPSEDGSVQLRIGEARPEAGRAVVGDVLFFHGFSDRMDNHRPLFEAWTRRGFRVVSFEYPSHGETCGKSLAFHLYPSLARLAAQVERSTREDEQRPLLLAGWSMGGLLATRLLQGLEPLSRPVTAAMLLTPGVAVHMFLGQVEAATLTRNPYPPHTGPIAPVRPSIFPIAANLLWHADEAREERLPEGIPVLTVVGGVDEDVYAKSREVRTWVLEKRAEGAATSGLACAGGYHEIDNEPAPMGGEVCEALGRFAEEAVKPGRSLEPLEVVPGACASF